jgi:hypothetical protein
MKTRFFCPHCRGVLNPTAELVLTARVGSVGGLIFFNPEPGSYRYQCDESLHSCLKEGDEVDFFCPICGADLVSPSAATLVEIVIKTPEQKTKVARFSRVCGEHATFVSDGEVVQSFGQHSARYQGIDFSSFEWRW